MSIGHYENFPVGSILLPKRLRYPVAVVYRFARTADDFADEGTAPPGERLAHLEEYRAALRRIAEGKAARGPLFAALEQVVRDHSLPLAPFFDLLDAFSQDVTKQRYADFGELMHYCRRSADPVGRLMLHLYGRADERHFGWSDAICSALQLINFWQDVEVDYRKNRIYLPQDEMAQFGIAEQQIASRDSGGEWPRLMQFQIERSRAMIRSGLPLASRLPGRIGLELRLIVQGGLRILEKLEQARGDMFRHRPVLKAPDWPLMFVRAFATR